MTALWSSPEHRSERCARCAGERLFEQPPCLDGHEPGECPEWSCVECGHAIFVGLPEIIGPRRAPGSPTSSGSAEPGRVAEAAGPARQLVTAAV